MLLKFAVYYTDRSSRLVEFEKPPGANPESKMSVDACLRVASTHGIVEKICKADFPIDTEVYRRA